MTFLSTMVSAGRGTGMVCAVGLQTQIGKIAALMHESREETTPLQKKLGELGKFLSLGSLGICIVLFLLAIVQKRPVFDMLLTAISLAVAAVPEGLPAVVTLCLALSVTRDVYKRQTCGRGANGKFIPMRRTVKARKSGILKSQQENISGRQKRIFPCSRKAFSPVHRRFWKK